MNAICGTAIILFAIRERRRFFDYRLFMIAPATTVNDESTYSRVLDFLVYQISFQWLFLEHFVATVRYYWTPGMAPCYMITHHMLTLVIVSAILTYDFFNAYSLVPLCLHFFVALGVPWLVPGFYGLYVSSYLFNLVIGAYLLYNGPALPPAVTMFGRVLLTLIACHVLNLLEFGRSSALAYAWDSGGWLFACATFAILSAAYLFTTLDLQEDYTWDTSYLCPSQNDEDDEVVVAAADASVCSAQ